MSSKLSERLYAVPPGVWVSAALFTQFVGVAYATLADGGESVTAQLLKATDASGTGSTNFGTAVTTTQAGTSPLDDELLLAAADGRSDQLGENGSGVQYTHVSLQQTDTTSPSEPSGGMLICGDARFSTDTLGGLGLNVSNTHA